MADNIFLTINFYLIGNFGGTRKNESISNRTNGPIERSQFGFFDPSVAISQSREHFHLSFSSIHLMIAETTVLRTCSCLQEHFKDCLHLSSIVFETRNPLHM